MERGYLVAALAIIVTFTGLSRGFQAMEQWSVAHVRHLGALAKVECHQNAAARAIARVQTRLRPHYAEEAQLLAEMNVPVPPVPPNVAEELAGENIALSERARSQAMQEAERMRRDMLRMQRDVQRTSRQMRIEPMSLHVQLPPDFQQRIQESTQAAMRTAREQVKAQLGSRCRTSGPADSEQ